MTFGTLQESSHAQKSVYTPVFNVKSSIAFSRNIGYRSEYNFVPMYSSCSPLRQVSHHYSKPHIQRGHSSHLPFHFHIPFISSTVLVRSREVCAAQLDSYNSPNSLIPHGHIILYHVFIRCKTFSSILNPITFHSLSCPTVNNGTALHVCYHPISKSLPSNISCTTFFLAILVSYLSRLYYTGVVALLRLSKLVYQKVNHHSVSANP